MLRPQQLTAKIVLGCLLFMSDCSKEFLDVTPNGAFDNSVLATYEGVDALLVGAYSMLGGVSEQFGWESATSGWVFSSIRGMESNKGTDSGDPPSMNPIMNFCETETSPYLNAKWRAIFESVSRCNSTLVSAHMAFELENITEHQYHWFTRQARALRGFYHFEAWRLWADRTIITICNAGTT